MDQEQPERDEELVRRLGNLKAVSPEYPAHLRAGRRAAVLAGLAAIPVGGSAASLLARFAKFFKAMGPVDKVILTVEVAAVTGLTTYGAVSAYIYRDALKQLLIPSAVHTPFPTLSIPLQSEETETEASTRATPTATVTATLTPTPLFGQASTRAAGSQEAPGQPQAPDTAVPLNPTSPPKPTATRGGLHLGQTKTPKPTPTP